jgi:P-type conjugative transfer protein TrbG
MKRIIFVTTLLALQATTSFDDTKNSIVPDPVHLAAENWQTTGTARILKAKDGQLLFPFGESQPIVTCSVNHVCDIELQRGEIIQNVAVGDTARWYLQPAQSGSGSELTPHVIIKPTQESLETNLILTTDKRTYYLTLKSTEREYVTRVGFYYPKELVQSWNKAAQAKITSDADKVAELPALEKLDFAYSISGTAAFKPERVFNDSIHVYIQMPASLKSTEAPALMLLDKSGSTQLVNYRVAGSYYVVDRLFDKAVLLTGTGRNEQKITITRKAGSCFFLDCIRG